jgi:hypothetical protein
MTKKNISKTILLFLIVWFWLPTGFSDFFIIPAIIDVIGMQMYILISIILVVYLYNSIEGKTLNDKIDNIKKELKKVF